MDNQKIKQIFESEIKRHSEGIKEHKELGEKTGSKRQWDKMMKHIHKLFQTKLLAKELGFNFCECCGRIK